MSCCFVCLAGLPADNYSRMHKKSGAWMSAFRGQSKNADPSGEHVYPIIINNNNFAKGGEASRQTLCLHMFFQSEK